MKDSTKWNEKINVEKGRDYISVLKMPDVVESHSELTFLKLFEQIGEAMPQFLIAFTFYVHHTYYLDIYDAIVP